MTTAKRLPGRPPLYSAKMRRIDVTLDPQTIERGRKLGNGSLSLGIRIALNRGAKEGASRKKPAPGG